MISRSAFRLPVLGLLAISFVACGNKEAPPSPVPDKVDEAKPPKVEDKPEAKVEDKPEAKAEAKVEAKPEAKAEAKPEDKPEVKVEDKGEAKAKVEDKAKADGKEAGEPKSLVPATKNGILSKGAADKIVKAGSRSVVHVLAPGAEPRSPVAYALAKGPSKPFRMAMDLEMAMNASAVKIPPTKVPRMALLFDFSTGERKGGDWPIDGKVAGVTVEPNGAAEEQIAAALRPQIEPMKGFGMTYLVDERGRVHDLKMSWPEGMPAQAQQMVAGMSQSLESMTAPLPEEPIGIGAKWEVIGRAAANGADLLQVSTFELKERKGDVITLDIGVRQIAANDKVSPPGMPKIATAKLLSFDAKGRGSSVIDTKDIAPMSGSMAMTTGMSLEISLSMDGKTETQKTVMDTKTTVTYSRPSK